MPTSLSRLVAELRRRRVFQATLIYAITSWIIVQVATTVAPLLNLPEWTPKLILLIALLGFPLMLVMAWVYDVTPTGVVATPATDVKPVITTTTSSPRSIAVLPFVDMSADHDQEHFSDGIAEEILNVLAKLPHLRVAARTSAFAFKGRSEDVRRIGEQLGVTTVLEGSVRAANNRLRITAQLISVADGYHLWSERYDRDMGDVFAIQDEIAQNIVRALDVAIGGETPARRRPTTSDITAYDYYLRGRYQMQHLSGDSVRLARDMFLQAIAHDKDYAAADAGAAEAYALLYLYFEATPANLAAAQEHSARALALAPGLAEVHTTRGQVLSLQKQYEDAAREFEAAIAIDPLSFDAHYYYARSAWAAGDLEKAERHMQRAATVRPEDYQSLCLLVSIAHTRASDEQLKAMARASLERVEKHIALHPGDGRALYMGAGALQISGQRQRAIEWAERALAADPNDPATLYNVACFYSLQGEKDRAFELLQRAIDNGFAHREWIENDGDLTDLRADARFPKLLDSMPK